MNEKKYIADIIQNEYTEWKPTDKIFITAPTGSGKTFFILNKLLDYLLENKPNINILYLVNRKVLKAQLLQELKDNAFRIQRVKNTVVEFVMRKITLMTYQEIEKELTNLSIQEILGKMQWMQRNYQIVVYDECHYFYADSNFNTYTELAYDFLTHCFQSNIQIFMSATMERIKNIFMNWKPIYYKKNPRFPQWDTVELILAPQVDSKNIEYFVEKDYSNVEVKLFEDIKEVEGVIRNSVCNAKEKWLIFVDNKAYGRKLEETLGKKNEMYPEAVIDSDEIVYIDTDYDYDEDAKVSIAQLTREKLIKRKVVITTAVMDNGVSFHDEDLRNIVIMADMEEEFIQMLGRKRNDDKEVTLYICKRDLNYFKRRLQMVNEKIKMYNKYGYKLNSMYEIRILQNVGRYAGTTLVPIYIGPFSSYRAWGEYDIGFDVSVHQKILVRILSSDYLFQNMKSFLYSYQGTLACSRISINRLYDLQEFYCAMLKIMENDEYGFAKIQMQWLDKDFNEIESVVTLNKEESDRYYRNILETKILEYLGEELTSDKNKEMKKKFAEALKYFLKLENGFDEKEIRDIPKSDRTITEESFNKLMKISNLPYKMKKPTGKTFKIVKSDVEENFE